MTDYNLADLISRSKVAKRLRVSRQRLVVLAAQGRLVPVQRIGQEWHYLRADVERYRRAPARKSGPKPAKNDA